MDPELEAHQRAEAKEEEKHTDLNSFMNDALEMDDSKPNEYTEEMTDA